MAGCHMGETWVVMVSLWVSCISLWASQDYGRRVVAELIGEAGEGGPHGTLRFPGHCRDRLGSRQDYLHVVTDQRRDHPKAHP